MSERREPTREVVWGDALAWLGANPAVEGACLLTSLPDLAELGIVEAPWRVFFAEAARLCLQAVPPTGVAFFFQTDKRLEGRWVSKAGILLREAEALGVPVLFHKVVCRKPPGTRLTGRPGFAHLLAFSHEARIPAAASRPDVLPELGEQPWSHSMGRAAAEEAMAAIRVAAPRTSLVLAPFCGVGTALAVANEHGYDAVGIERNRKRAALARGLRLEGLRRG